MFAEGGDLRFKSRAGRIGQSVALPLQHFFENSSAALAQWRWDGPRKLVTRSHGNTASIEKDLICFVSFEPTNMRNVKKLESTFSHISF